MEAKRQQDAERKAQLQKEKEDKKREREEAKKLKDKQKQDREEQRNQRNQDKDPDYEVGKDDEEEDEEGSLASPHARKKQRLSNSRRASRDDDADDYDNEQPDPLDDPISPGTGYLGSRSTNYTMQNDIQSTSMDRPSMDHQGSSSYLSPERQTQHEHQQTEPPTSDLAYASIFEATNLLTSGDRAYITAFLQGHPGMFLATKARSHSLSLIHTAVSDDAPEQKDAQTHIPLLALT